MKIIPCLFFCVLLITSCNNPADKLAEDFSELEAVQTKPDSIVDYYTEVVYDYYHKANFKENEIEIELNISGKRAYEDDSILILTFSEILQFGSWHYSDFSLFFLKDGKELIPVAPSLWEEKLLQDYYKKDTQYPYRIDGSIYRMIDLTRDGKMEYIFHTTSSVRTNFEEKYSIYHLNSETHSLERDALPIFSKGIQAECDTVYGQLSSLKVIEPYIIQIKEVISTCIDSLLKVQELKCTFTYYTWDQAKGKFKKIEQIKSPKLEHEEVNLTIEEDTIVAPKQQTRTVFMTGSGRSSRIDSIHFYKDKILKRGDVYSYHQLKIAMPRQYRSNLLSWALIMANKYQYAPACLDVAMVIAQTNGYSIMNLNRLDLETKELCLKYLRKSVKLGNTDAKDFLKHIETGAY